jgi:hypothetical protein
VLTQMMQVPVKIVRIFDQSKFHAIIQSLAAVAQLDRVLGYEPMGQEFESHPAHHTLKARSFDRAFFFYRSVLTG